MVRVNVHSYERRSRANGPGARFVVWFQGCSLGCPGCFNPATHRSEPAELWEVEALAREIILEAGRDLDGPIEGLTLSGGEPMEQPEAALALLTLVRAQSELSAVMYSGYTMDEIRAQPLGPAVLGQLDVLIDGRYQAGERLGRGMRGSQNQRIHLLSDRYTLADIEDTPEAEIRIDPRGHVVLTGVRPLRLKR